jgi:hypothetical protein
MNHLMQDAVSLRPPGKAGNDSQERIALRRENAANPNQ